jgi:HEAT repeat protein
MIALLIAAALASSGPSREAARKPQPQQEPAQARELPDAERDALIEGYLGSIDTPIGAARWRELGPKAAPRLQAIAKDPAQFASRRARAVDGLGAIAAPSSADFVLGLTRDASAPFVVRMSALRAAPRFVGADELVKQVGPRLDDTDARVRAIAAETLGQHGGPAGCALVQRAVKTQGEAAAGRSWQRALGACEAADR